MKIIMEKGLRRESSRITNPPKPKKGGQTDMKSVAKMWLLYKQKRKCL